MIKMCLTRKKELEELYRKLQEDAAAAAAAAVGGGHWLLGVAAVVACGKSMWNRSAPLGLAAGLLLPQFCSGW